MQSILIFPILILYQNNPTNERFLDQTNTTPVPTSGTE